MYKYKIVNNSVEEPSVREGKASLEKLSQILPNEIYAMLIQTGTLSIKEQSGHMTYEVSKVQ